MNNNDTTAPSSSLLVDVLSNGNHTNDNNTTAPSSSLSVEAVTVTVTLPCVRRVYCYHYCMPCATKYALSDGNHTNDNNTSTPSSRLSATAAAAVAYPWTQHKYST